jgi:putative hydrolase of the HAD superfamily
VCIIYATFKIFTNGDEVHAAKVLQRLGIEDCFEGIICFETLNPPSFATEVANESKIFDIEDYFAKINPGVELPKTPILCKPNIDAMELALKSSNINPQRTVNRAYCFNEK